MYPGGAPTSFDTECASLNSEQLICTSFSESKRKCAKPLAASVLPTPVPPRNKKDANGRLDECRPARLRRTASPIASRASSCPTIRRLRESSIPSRRSRSPRSKLRTGTPVILATTAAMSSLVTRSWSMFFCAASLPASSSLGSCASSSGMRPYCNSATRWKLPARVA